jgi:hypothetical protein
MWSIFFTSVFLLPLLGSQELAFRRGMYCHGTDLRVVMTRCCYDTSTDLTPERRVYIPPHLPYIVPHTTSFVNTTQYLVPRRHVL